MSNLTLPQKKLGVYDGGGYVVGTTYQAPSDGFVIGSAGTSGGQAVCYVDSFTPPTTWRLGSYAANALEAPLSFPVAKGEYWLITCSAGGISVSFKPLS